MARHRLTVDQAAANLGISTDAVRKRARRGSLESEKDSDGTVYVWLDDGPPRPDSGPPPQDSDTPDGAPGGPTPTQAHLDFALAQMQYLQGVLDTRDRELAEMRRLLAGALERIPAVEPPQDTPPDAPASPKAASEDTGKGATREEPQEGASGRSDTPSWWRRIFLGE
jgi:hypothetical protein